MSVTVDLAGEPRGDAAQTRADLLKAVSDGLAAWGLVVADGQPATFHVTFEEAAGETLPVYDRQSPFDLTGTDTGRKATASKCKATVELRTAASDAAVWSQQLGGNSPRSMAGPVDDASLRAAMLQTLCSGLRQLTFPTFVPAGPGLQPLPIVAGD